jgi:hypothetical protein
MISIGDFTLMRIGSDYPDSNQSNQSRSAQSSRTCVVVVRLSGAVGTAAPTARLLAASGSVHVRPGAMSGVCLHLGGGNEELCFGDCFDAEVGGRERRYRPFVSLR